MPTTDHIIIEIQNSAISAQDLSLSKSKIALARRAIPYSSPLQRKQRSSSSRLAADKKFGRIIKTTESILTETSTNFLARQGR
jgi:hypothetical protein